MTPPPTIRSEVYRQADGTTVHHVTDEELARLVDNSEAMAQEILAMRLRVLTPEEMAYVRNRKLADERAGWAWQWLRANVPWIAGCVSAFGAAVYWFATNLTWKPHP